MKIFKTVLIVILVSTSSIVFSQAHKIPPMNGSFPNMVSSAWHMYSIYNKVKGPKTAKPSGDVFIFCKTTHWEVVPQSGIGPTGDYRVQGNKLKITNNGSKETVSYNMTWNANDRVLQLDGSDVIMLLQYNGVTDCK